MRLPRVRFTVRRMMVVVGLAAVVSWMIAEAHGRRQHRTAMARLYSGKLTPLILKGLRCAEANPLRSEMSEEEVRRAETYMRLIREYNFRATRPWLSDPPEPK